MTTVHTDSATWWLRFTGPRFWPTWLVFAALWLVTRLPFSWQMGIGSLVGRIAWRLARRRRHIAEVNIRLCFPQLSDDQRAELVKAHFLSVGKGVVETALCWWGRESQLRHTLTLFTRGACAG